MRCLVLLSSVLLGLAFADSLDYSRQSVIVVSLETGASSVQSTAALNARALQALKGASYDRDWTVGSYLASHPLAQRRLERMNLANQRLGTKYLSDGTVSTEFEFPLTNGVLGLIVPVRSAPRLLGRTACPCCGQPWPEGKEPPSGVRLVPYEEDTGPGYTGVLVDAKGLALRPALFPRVVTEAGEEVAGPDFADPEQIGQRGLVGYFSDRTQALTADRIGPNPLVVRALGVAGTNACDLVVSRSDAALIHGSQASLELLRRCQVGFLVD